MYAEADWEFGTWQVINLAKKRYPQRRLKTGFEFRTVYIIRYSTRFISQDLTVARISPQIELYASTRSQM